MDKFNSKCSTQKLDPSFKRLKPEGNCNQLKRPKSNIVNLSNYVLSSAESSLLERGLKFVPTPKDISITPLLTAASQFGRRIKLKYFFRFKPPLSDVRVPFQNKSNWEPPDFKIDNDILTSISNFTEKIGKLKPQKEKLNLSNFEYLAIKTLKNNKEIIIKKADKGSATVIMNKMDYIQEGNRQLNNPNYYRKLDSPIYPETAIQIDNILKRMLKERLITKKQYTFLAPPQQPRPRYFYILPKIHKELEKWPSPSMPPGRPIVSDCGSESKNISKFIEFHIKSKANQHPAFLKDTDDFLSKVRSIETSPSDLLITLDVDNMYTNICVDEGVQAVREVLDCSISLNSYILELLELNLKTNDFQFNGDTFLQLCGTAMGRDYAPSFANIFMAKWEKQALEKCPLKPKIYLRFLDDIFIVWEHGKDEFQTFFDTLNSHHPNIKLKATIDQNSVDFLDTTIFKNPTDGKSLLSKVFFKPTDTHQLLHKNSFHPKHTFSGIIKSQILRFYKISSLKQDFDHSCNVLFHALGSRNYSKRWLRKIKIDTIRLIERNLEPSPISMEGPSFGSSKPCNSRKCKTCQYVISCQNFTGLEDHINYSILSDLDCSSVGIIYLAICNLCNKQYVGQTANSLRQRWAHHKFDLINNNQTNALAKHNEAEHQLQANFKVIPIEKVPNQKSNELNLKLRLEREQFWIDTLGTFAPHGLNLDFQKPKISRNSDSIPIILPFSKTANLAAKTAKEIYSDLIKLEHLEDFLPVKFITAYSRHKNISDLLVSSKS